ncbi:hypothetical protein [Photobacterium profundum]|uniref:Uncharacterized protein n=1 Tax=Photobacterium profundum (strain SS9) TaxID=298386 RepID=Q6LHV4_PHOPR|nr:hypothetical protein [Photobacterium profundum]CAG23126.1 hypothetical protein PBPRB1255 [Photobacterium profundum SS9]
MTVHISTATVFAHENQNNLMNLHFNPMVYFDDCWEFPAGYLDKIKWVIESEIYGNHEFTSEISGSSLIESAQKGNVLEFHLVIKNVPFQYENSACKLKFTAVLNSHEHREFDEEFWGVVKTRWSKGLQ